MGRILDAVEACFAERGWRYRRIEGKPIYAISFEMSNGDLECFAQAREEQEQFLFYTVYSVKIPEAKRAQAAELLTRANYGLVIGNFELDMTDGEVRYKTSIDVEGEVLSCRLIRTMVGANLATADRYTPAVMGFLYGNMSPVEALRQVEGR